MATLATAQKAQTKAMRDWVALFGLQPVAVGIVAGDRDGDYSLKVTLPSRPRVQPPGEVAGVRVVYDVGQPALAGSRPDPPWMTRVRQAGGRHTG